MATSRDCISILVNNYFRELFHREIRAGNRHLRVALMDHIVRVGATMDQCTQTPFPGSELLDSNPFVPSPIKPKDPPGAGDKRARRSDSVSSI